MIRDACGWEDWAREAGRLADRAAALLWAAREAMPRTEEGHLTTSAQLLLEELERALVRRAADWLVEHAPRG